MPDPLYTEAIKRFETWLGEARAALVPEFNAMSLSTATPDGRPSARMVLLKAVDEDGFVFFTNTQSRKGRQLADNPQVALTFFWMPLYRQVLVEGRVQAVLPAEADAYWETRDRASQIGGWASLQSQTLDDRATLEKRYQQIEQEYEGRDIPRPPHWSGFRVQPDLFEFWTGRDHRLHDRERFELIDGKWQKRALFP